MTIVGTIPGKKQKKAIDTCEEPSVYDGFLPLWDRKWLFESELWIFDRGYRDCQFAVLDDVEALAKRNKHKAKTMEKDRKASEVVVHRYPTKRVVVNHDKDEIDSPVHQRISDDEHTLSDQDDANF